MKRRFYVATISVLSFLLSVAGSPVVANEAEPDEARRAALELLEVTGARAMCDQILNQMLAQLSGSGVEVPREPFSEADRDELIELIISIYVKHLTVEEMQAAIDFYRSPAGRSLIEKMPVILQESMTAGQQWGAKAMEEIRAKMEGAPGGAPQAPANDRGAQRKTISDMRRVGTAMMSWLVDMIEDRGDPWPPERGDAQRSWRATRSAAGGRKAVDLTFFAISHEEVVRLLVPDFIDEVPDKDGWGHPYQFAINDDILASSVMSVRSPGRDGVFEDGAHAIGTFDPEDYDHDVVWADGYFIVYPAAE